MDDLVERLRDAGYVLVSPGMRKLAHEAASRIQALETSLAEAGKQLRANAETLAQVPAAITEARRQALEEAAKVADAKWDHWRNEHAKTGEADALFIAETCESIGIAIRALASDPLLDRQGE